MDARETTFQRLIQGDNQFQIPLYQRTYSWTRDDHKRLWSDLAEQAAELSSPRPGAPAVDNEEPVRHFLGSLVLAPRPPIPDTVQRWVVIDGQQRLTTLMLLACALRDHVRLFDAPKADLIHRRYLINEEDFTGLDRYRLLPTQADRPSYLACVDGQATAGGEDNVGAAYRFFRAALAEYDSVGDWEVVRFVDLALRHRLSLVSITAGPRDNVYRIFESLNNTGVPLTQADLLRNYVFMNLPRLSDEVYEKLWLPMQTELGPDRMVTLAWLDLVLQGDTRAKQSEVYVLQQRRLSAVIASGGEPALRDEISRLHRLAAVLLRVTEPARESHPGLREVLNRLGEWGSEVHYPLALYILDRVEQGAAEPDEAVQALSYIESFLVRRMICYVRTNNLNRVLAAAPSELEQDRPLAEAVHRYLSGPRRYWPTDAQQRDAIRTQPFYWRGKHEQRFFVLRRLEESYAAAEPVDFERARLTIEHVLPQTPTPEWLGLLAEEVTDEEGPEELHELLLHTLGNLTLTGENGRLSNHLFQRKQQILDSSTLRMNREIAAAERWGKAEILARAERLADRAAQLWPAPLPAGFEESDERSEWALLRQILAGMPAGFWTTYGDVAAVIGIHPRPLGTHLATRRGIPNPHRVLTASGVPSPEFAWLDGRTETQREALEREGVRFQGARADVAQRLYPVDLAGLAGMEAPEAATPSTTPSTTDQGGAVNRPVRFRSLLTDHQPDVADGVLALLAAWEANGGWLSYGSTEETSCFPMLRKGGGAQGEIWPVAIYPRSGRVEVVFEHLSRREPFTRPELLMGLLDRINAVPGVHLDVDAGEINRRRPGFPIDVLNGAGLERFRDVLTWFCNEASRL
ncbi:DUF262 domain-containing protein [Kitasatospora sp. NPDC051984]|uniref:GmrSD restriction endonuclease domain-containing protein n=1 Tax=Kitasatospora sp. NPDC051984 TaxID=3364059 RepID=UPI0037C8F727